MAPQAQSLRTTKPTLVTPSPVKVKRSIANHREGLRPRRNSKLQVAAAAASLAAAFSSSVHPANAALAAVPNRKSTPSPKKNKQGKRTESFNALWAGNLPWIPDHQKNTTTVKPHTLLLGTHPSIASLGASQYYGHPLNAFWWIVGDCLGFRRDSGLKKNGEPYKLASALRYTNILSYQEQVELLTNNGFCLWDVVKSCVRPGSLDSDISGEVPNEVQEFCNAHPTINRIVLVNGGTGATLFNKHFKEWWKSGELVAAEDDSSQRAFGRLSRKYSSPDSSDSKVRRIYCLAPMSVSPAAAKFTYEEKRDFWEQHVYQPGLAEMVKLRK